jgi:hypothetical protein
MAFMTRVDTIAALRALPVPAGSTQASVAGYYTPGDKGNGIFYYNTTSVLSDDGGMVIQPDSLPVAGRWLRLYKTGEVNVCWFGVKPGILPTTGPFTPTENAVCFNKAIEFCGRRFRDGWEFYNSAKVIVPRADQPYQLGLTLKCNTPNLSTFVGTQNIYICCQEIGGAELEFCPPVTSNLDYDSPAFVDIDYLMYFYGDMGIGTACGAYNLTLKGGGILVGGDASDDAGHSGAIRFVELHIDGSPKNGIWFTAKARTVHALLERCYFDNCYAGAFIESPTILLGTVNKCRFSATSNSALTLDCTGFYVTDCEFDQIMVPTEEDVPMATFIHLSAKSEGRSSINRISGCRFGPGYQLHGETVLYRHPDYAVVVGDLGDYVRGDSTICQNVRFEGNYFIGSDALNLSAVPLPKAAFYLNAATSSWLIRNSTFTHYQEALVTENYILTEVYTAGGNYWGFNSYDASNGFVHTFTQGGVGWQSAEKMYGRDVFVRDTASAANILSAPDDFMDSRWIISSNVTRTQLSMVLPDGTTGPALKLTRTANGNCFIRNNTSKAVIGPVTFGVWLKGSLNCKKARIAIGDSSQFFNDVNSLIYVDENEWKYFTITIPNVNIPIPDLPSTPTPVSPKVYIYVNSGDSSVVANEELYVWGPTLCDTYKMPGLSVSAPAIAGAGVYAGSMRWQSLALGRNYWGYGTAAPATGYYNQGDYIQNTTPVELGTSGTKYIVKGWSCVTGGTSAVWLPQHTLTGN